MRHQVGASAGRGAVAAGGQWPSDDYLALAQVVPGAGRCAQP
ncbi:MULTISPECIES: hypothetical protein [Paracoccus]|nr:MULTISPECIES: hypothetical protein [Paracoccus]